MRNSTRALWFLSSFLLFSINHVFSQDSASIKSTESKPVASHKKWFEKISIRGYTQVRYNRLLETNAQLKCEQCDRSWGESGGISFRRIRIILFGQLHERLYFYIQPDFASSVSPTALHFAQIRDAYFDLSLDRKGEYRLRFGQSKIPFGFENLQSSQNRLPLDRNDALNSAFSNERDLAVFFYWAPAPIRERFSQLVSSGVKGSGDYGVFGLGVFNGQSANRPDANNHLHLVARASYPFQLRNGQTIEPGLQAFTGNTVVSSVGKGVKGINDAFEYRDSRIAGTFVLYPKPFGIQAEYNYGTGPQYNSFTNNIEQKTLKGGYVTASYLIRKNDAFIIPFTRYQYYEGGKKFEMDARSYTVNEWELGVEWQPFKNFELVAMYTISDRTFEDSTLPQNRQKGSLLRLQFQFNY
jgi:phosphate-selective porin